MKKSIKFRLNRLSLIAYPFLFLVISLTAAYDYLLFHTLIEIVSILIAYSVFILAWYTRKFSQNDYLSFLGIAFLFVGSMDLLHTLSYQGIGIFTGYDANLPTQFWLAARYLQAAAFLAAPLIADRLSHFSRDAWMKGIFINFASVTALLLAAIFLGFFPDSYIPGTGLTNFKIYSEYFIVFILGLSIYSLSRRDDLVGEDTYRNIVIATVLTIVSEMFFTVYFNVNDVFNLIGHYLKAASFSIIFLTLVKGSLERPYSLLFSNLKSSQEEVTKLNRALETLYQSLRHDLYNNLTAIQLNLDLFEMGQQKKEVLDGIKTEVKKIQLMVEKAKELESNLKSGAKLEVYAVSEVVNQVAENHPDLDVQLKGDAVVRADEALYSVFENLFKNARMHGDADVIKVDVKNNPDQIRIEVADNGKGFPAEIKDKIFEKGFSYGPTGNTGMGLYLVKKIIKRFGGKIEVIGEETQGAVFSFTLPRIDKMNLNPD